MTKIIISVVSAFIISTPIVFAQEDTITNATGSNIIFSDIKEVGKTSVKDQNKSGTCWSFSSMSFFESEILRMGGKEVNLSEMFIVRNTYSLKADVYVRMHGHVNFGAGGAFHDVTHVAKQFGLVPQQAYSGNTFGEELPIHGEMDAVLESMVKAVVMNKNKKLTSVWKKAYDAVLDVYLGEVPERFDYEGKAYTPQSFAKSLGINADDYIEISSFTHHPFYEKFILEVPDNWMWDEVYNVPLDEMMQIMNNALENGYSIAWGADISDRGFAYKKGIMTWPDLNWEDLEKEERDSIYLNPIPQAEVTQLSRQEGFDNYETTDDHGMHIVGTAKDQKGTKYYIVKNSWGEDNECGGYQYATESFVKAKTIDFLVHKNAIPKSISKKLGIK